MKAILIPLLAFMLLPVYAAEKSTNVPDFTKGQKIPKDAKHDWNLGATGRISILSGEWVGDAYNSQRSSPERPKARHPGNPGSILLSFAK